MTDSALLQRLEALEAQQAILALKSRYLASCDGKNPEGFRACFADGPVDIDYGSLGRFDTADALTAVFREIACHEHMLEWHHASNPQIELQGPDKACGSWSLHYQLINSQEQTLTQLGGEYADRYRRIDGHWKIIATHFKPRTCLVVKLDENAMKTVYAGPNQG